VKNPSPNNAVRREAEPLSVPVPEPALASEPELTLEQKINKVEDLTMVIDKWRKFFSAAVSWYHLS
jgi:hypothetical protein